MKEKILAIIMFSFLASGAGYAAALAPSYKKTSKVGGSLLTQISSDNSITEQLVERLTHQPFTGNGAHYTVNAEDPNFFKSINEIFDHPPDERGDCEISVEPGVIDSEPSVNFRFAGEFVTVIDFDDKPMATKLHKRFMRMNHRSLSDGSSVHTLSVSAANTYPEGTDKKDDLFSTVQIFVDATGEIQQIRGASYGHCEPSKEICQLEGTDLNDPTCRGLRYYELWGFICQKNASVVSELKKNKLNNRGLRRPIHPVLATPARPALAR